MRSIPLFLVATQALVFGCAGGTFEDDTDSVAQAALPQATLAIECESPTGANVGTSTCFFVDGQFSYRIRLNVTASAIPVENRDYVWVAPPGGTKVVGCGRSNNFCVYDVVPPCTFAPTQILTTLVFLRDNRQRGREIREEGSARFSVQGVNAPGCDGSIPDDFRACNAPPANVPAFDFLYDLGDQCFGTARVFWDSVNGATRYESTLRALSYGGNSPLRVYEGPANQYAVRVNVSSHVFLRACNHCGCTAWSAPVTVGSTNFCFDDR